ncbi:undecaprenyldiphospho-muramoylpentapeptide beta-N-acetylglucosaminyltransferase [Thermatribacter velox]|uniref:UDP-N-acetylglucosamine--N-acetylmuramyl-(pentapeptide) pyrophosphoryl-undecaprenol N-acetylglucosamine transferase n=1 Tax=Thermatribacter velox TaxID=3039681 RepID=A0ABZ2Y827_9BACT
MRINYEMTGFNILIAAGGTGGHIFPSLAIVEELRELNPGGKVFFVGSTRKLEKELFASQKLPFFAIKARGWNRTLDIDLLKALVTNAVGIWQAFYVILKTRPNALLCMGSYPSLLTAFWAKILGIPIFVHEQNALPGMANRIVGRWAKRIFVSVPESKPHFPQEKVVVTGNPLRKDLLCWKNRKTEAREKLALKPDNPTILVMGGSLGAEIINTTLWKILDELVRESFQILHITGNRDFATACKITSSERYRPIPFSNSPGILYAASDLVICRSGASTIFELLWFGIPSILVPLKEAAENHQYYNALWLQKKQKVEIIQEEELTPNSLKEAIKKLYQSSKENTKQRREDLDVKTINPSLEKAARIIAEIIVEDLKGGKSFE